MIRINNLKVKYKDFVALDIEDEIAFESGDRIAIVGANGAGKTSFIKAIINDVSYEGDIECNQEDVAVHMQNNEYNEKVSIKDLIELVTQVKYEDNIKIQELVEHFEFGECIKKSFKKLSGGEKQKFTLILVIYQDKPITFFDEPTSGLDYVTRENLLELLAKYYKDKDATIGYVTHYYEEIKVLANKLFLFDKGKLICHGNVDELFKKYCGQSVFLVEEEIEDVPFEIINSSLNKTIIKSNSKEESKKIFSYLIDNDYTFTKSSADVSLLINNIKEEYYGGVYE